MIEPAPILRSTVNEALTLLLSSSPLSPNEEQCLRPENQKLEDLSDETLRLCVQSLVIATAELTREASRWTAVINKQRNARLPICQLPVEVFGLILLHVVDYEWNLPRSEVLRQLASVATSWLRVVLSTPELWCEVQNSDPRSEWLIERSGALPLSFTYRKPAGYHSDDEDPFFTRMIQQLQRCRELDVANSQQRIAAAISDTPLPHLQKLQWEGKYYIGTCMPLAETPNLRELGVRFWRLDLTSSVRPSIYPKLMKLTLYHCSVQHPAALELVLRNCPSLEAIHLALISLELSTAFTPTGSFELPRLAELILHEISPELVDMILGQVRATNLFKILLKMPDCNTPQHVWQALACSELLWAALRNFKRSSDAWLRIVIRKGARLEMRDETGDRINLVLRAKRLADVLLDCRPFDNGDLPRVAVQIDHQIGSYAFLEAIPTLAGIVIAGSSSPLRSLLKEFLSIPLGDGRIRCRSLLWVALSTVGCDGKNKELLDEIAHAITCRLRYADSTQPLGFYDHRKAAFDIGTGDFSIRVARRVPGLYLP